LRIITLTISVRRYFEQNDDFKSDHCVGMTSGAEQTRLDALSRKFGKPRGAQIQWRSIPVMFISTACADATRILEAGLWRNHVPTGNPRHDTVASNPVSGAPAASVATTNAGSNPVDMHHPSSAEAIHHLHHLRR